MISLLVGVQNILVSYVNIIPADMLLAFTIESLAGFILACLRQVYIIGRINFCFIRKYHAFFCHHGIHSKGIRSYDYDPIFSGLHIE